MKFITKLALFFILFIKMLSVSLTAQSQQYQSFLYGSITTTDSITYTGAIRWDEEEVFLTDIFNASKTENPYIEYVNKLSSPQNPLSYPIGNRGFQCQFGDIASITVTGLNSAIVELKNQKFIAVRANSNDIGNTVQIMEQELGLLNIDWNKIKEVKFFPPKTFDVENFGNPIYGKITTSVGEFTGFIQWDKDERLLSDKLDGYSAKAKLSIPFSKISNIQKIKQGVNVTLISGRQVVLKNTNDVTSINRGIVVTIPNVGRIILDWKHFLSANITAFPKKFTNCYNLFPATKRLAGTICTKANQQIKGIIIYDLDEAMDAEILDGLNDHLQFEIPFRNIKKIETKSYDYCLVELKKGNKLYLGDQTDVSDKGMGFLIFTGGDKYQYYQWNEIKWIEFE